MPLLTDLLATNTSNIAANTTAVASAGGAWKLLSTVDVSGATAADFTDVFDGTYQTYNIVGDNLYHVPNSMWIYIRLKTSAGILTSGYAHTMHYADAAAAGQGYWQGNGANWPLMYDTGRDHSKVFECTLTGLDSGKKPTAKFHLGSGSGAADALHAVGGYMLNNTNTITGIEIRSNSVSFVSGKVKIYGLV